MQRTENIRKQEEAPELDFFSQLQSMTFLVVLYYNIIIASRHFSVFPAIKYLIHVPTARNMNHVPCMQSDLISKTVGACSLQPYNCPVFSSCTLTIAPCSLLPQVSRQKIIFFGRRRMNSINPYMHVTSLLGPAPTRS
jgi:hypothetical protein